MSRPLFGVTDLIQNRQLHYQQADLIFDYNNSRSGYIRVIVSIELCRRKMKIIISGSFVNISRLLTQELVQKMDIR